MLVVFYSSIWGLLSYSFYTFWPSVATENLVAKWATHSQRAVPCAALSKKSLTFAQKKVRMFRMRHKMLREVSWIYMDLLQLIFPFLCFPSVFFVNLDQRAQVWTGNLQHEFSLFSQWLRSAAVVAIDTEFPGVIQENAWKESEETHYRAMKDWTSCFFFVLDNHWQFQWVPGSLFF